MKTTGITRKLDDLGRIVIPRELRKELRLEENTKMEILVDGNKIILQKFGTCCHCCGKESISAEVLGVSLCSECIEDFNKARDMMDRMRNRSEKK